MHHRAKSKSDRKENPMASDGRSYVTGYFQLMLDGVDAGIVQMFGGGYLFLERIELSGGGKPAFQERLSMGLRIDPRQAGRGPAKGGHGPKLVHDGSQAHDGSGLVHDASQAVHGGSKFVHDASQAVHGGSK